MNLWLAYCTLVLAIKMEVRNRLEEYPASIKVGNEQRVALNFWLKSFLVHRTREIFFWRDPPDTSRDSGKICYAFWWMNCMSIKFSEHFARGSVNHSFTSFTFHSSIIYAKFKFCSKHAEGSACAFDTAGCLYFCLNLNYGKTSKRLAKKFN